MRNLTYFLVGGVLAILLISGAYFGAFFYVGTQLRQALDESMTRLPPGWTVTYKTADVTSLLPRQVRLTGIEIRHAADASPDATIAEIDLVDPSLDPAALSLTAIAADGADAQKPVPLADSIGIKDVVWSCMARSMTSRSPRST